MTLNSLQDESIAHALPLYILPLGQTVPSSGSYDMVTSSQYELYESLTNRLNSLCYGLAMFRPYKVLKMLCLALDP